MAETIAWTDRAKADLRAIDRQTALDLMHGIARFLATEEGDAKRLQGIEPPELRLRLGDYRVRFDDHGESIEILAVKHRTEAYGSGRSGIVTRLLQRLRRLKRRAVRPPLLR